MGTIAKVMNQLDAEEAANNVAPQAPAAPQIPPAPDSGVEGEEVDLVALMEAEFGAGAAGAATEEAKAPDQAVADDPPAETAAAVAETETSAATPDDAALDDRLSAIADEVMQSLAETDRDGSAEEPAAVEAGEATAVVAATEETADAARAPEAELEPTPETDAGEETPEPPTAGPQADDPSAASVAPDDSVAGDGELAPVMDEAANLYESLDQELGDAEEGPDSAPGDDAPLEDEDYGAPDFDAASIFDPAGALEDGESLIATPTASAAPRAEKPRFAMFTKAPGDKQTSAPATPPPAPAARSQPVREKAPKPIAGKAKSAHPALITLRQPAGALSAEYRALAEMLVNDPAGPRTLMVTSSVDGEGKSVTCANLAVALAQCEQQVVVVDAGGGKGGVAALLGVSGGAGWAGLLRDPSGVATALRPTSVEGLEVIPAGAIGKGAWAEAALTVAMSSIRSACDIVLVDAPAVARGPGALALGNVVDAVLFVLAPRRVARGAARKAVARLRGGGANLLGCVVSHVA